MPLLVFGIQPCWSKCYMIRKRNPPVPRELLKAARCRAQVSGPVSLNLKKNPVAAGHRKLTSHINTWPPLAGAARPPSPRTPEPKSKMLVAVHGVHVQSSSGYTLATYVQSSPTSLTGAIQHELVFSGSCIGRSPVLTTNLENRKGQSV